VGTKFAAGIIIAIVISSIVGLLICISVIVLIVSICTKRRSRPSHAVVYPQYQQPYAEQPVYVNPMFST